MGGRGMLSMCSELQLTDMHFSIYACLRAFVHCTYVRLCVCTHADVCMHVCVCKTVVNVFTCTYTNMCVVYRVFLKYVYVCAYSMSVLYICVWRVFIRIV